MKSTTRLTGSVGDPRGRGGGEMQGRPTFGNAIGAVGSNGTLASSAVPTMTFAVEDTQDSSYRDVGAHLTRKFGWTAVPYRRPQKGTGGPRPPTRSPPSLVWCVHERDVPFAELPESQLVNHFQGISKLTSKQGLCELIRESAWLLADAQEICPRTYDLSQPSQRAEFADDFRLSAATNILKLCSLHRQIPKRLSHVSLSLATIHQAVIAVQCHLAITAHGAWPGIDDISCTAASSNCVNIHAPAVVGGDPSRGSTSLHKLPLQSLLARGDFGLTHMEWADLLHVSYQIVAADVMTKWSLEIMDAVCPDIELSPMLIRVRILLRNLAKISPQLHCSGTRNVWLAKAPEAARGTGIKILYKLQDIFDLERRMCGRIVQKYIETPLLVPMLRDDAIDAGNNASTHLHSMPRSLPAPSNMVKFDLRVWVAVTSYQPLKAHIFPSVYGRMCGKPFTLATKALGNDFVHLANYSVQKATVTASNSASAPATSTNSNAALVQGSEVAAMAPPSDLLLSNADLVDTIDRIYPSRGKELWHGLIWPELKRRVMCLLSLSRPYVTHRSRSFELLGVDVLLDETLIPWILEMNMSPGLAHRNEQQNALIKSMIEGLLDLVVSPVFPDASASSNASAMPPDAIASAWEPLHSVTLGPDAMQVMRGLQPVPLRAENIIRAKEVINLKTDSELSCSAAGVNIDAIEYAEFDIICVNSEDGVASDAENKHGLVRPTGAESGTPLSEKSGNRLIGSYTIGTSGRSLMNPSSVPSSGPSLGARSQSTAPKQAQPRFNTSSRAVPSTEAIESKNLLALIQHQFDAAPLLVEGFVITKETMTAVDANIRVYEKLDLIKRWAKRWFLRLHAHNQKRCAAATKIQNRMRILIAKKTRVERICWLCARIIQCRVRILLARRDMQRRVRNRAVIAVQRMVKKRLFRNEMYKRVLSRLARKIQLKFRNYVHRKRCTAVMRLIRIARLLLEYRKRCRRIVVSCIKLWYFRRRRAAETIKSNMGPYRYYLRRQRRIRKDFFRAAANKANLRNKGLRHVFKSKLTATSRASVGSGASKVDGRESEGNQGSGDPLSPLFKISAQSSRYVSPVISAIELVRSIMSPDSRARSELEDSFSKRNSRPSSPSGKFDTVLGSANDLNSPSPLKDDPSHGAAASSAHSINGTFSMSEDQGIVISNLDSRMGGRLKEGLSVSKSLSYSTSSEEDSGNDDPGAHHESADTTTALDSSNLASRLSGNTGSPALIVPAAPGPRSALEGEQKRSVPPPPPRQPLQNVSTPASRLTFGEGTHKEENTLNSSQVYESDISMQNERSASSDVGIFAVGTKKKPMALSLFRAENADLKSKTRALQAKAQLIMDDVKRLAESGLEQSEDTMSSELRATLKNLEPSPTGMTTYTNYETKSMDSSKTKVVQTPSYTLSANSIRGQKSTTSHVGAVRSLRERSEDSIDATTISHYDDSHPPLRDMMNVDRVSGAPHSPFYEARIGSRLRIDENDDASLRVSYNEWMTEKAGARDDTRRVEKSSRDGVTTAYRKQHHKSHKHDEGSIIAAEASATRRQEDEYYASITPLELDRNNYRTGTEDNTKMRHKDSCYKKKELMMNPGAYYGRPSLSRDSGFTGGLASLEVPPPWDEPENLGDASLSLGASSDDSDCCDINTTKDVVAGRSGGPAVFNGRYGQYYSDLDPSHVVPHRPDVISSFVDNSVGAASEYNVSGGGSAERLRKNVQQARSNGEYTIHRKSGTHIEKRETSSRQKSGSNYKSTKENSKHINSENPSSAQQARLQRQLQLAQENYAKKLAKKEEQMQLSQAVQLTRNESKPFNTSLKPADSDRNGARSRSREPVKSMRNHDSQHEVIIVPDAKSRQTKSRPSTSTGASRSSTSSSKLSSARHDETNELHNNPARVDGVAASSGVPVFALRMAALVQGKTGSHSTKIGGQHVGDDYSDGRIVTEKNGSMPNTARGDFYSRAFQQQRNESPGMLLSSADRDGRSINHEFPVDTLPTSAVRMLTRSEEPSRAYDTETFHAVPRPSSSVVSAPFRPDSKDSNDPFTDSKSVRDQNSMAESDADLAGVDSAMVEWIHRMETRKALQRDQSRRNHHLNSNPRYEERTLESSYGVDDYTSISGRYADRGFGGTRSHPNEVLSNSHRNPQMPISSYSETPRPPPNDPPPRTRASSTSYTYARGTFNGRTQSAAEESVYRYVPSHHPDRTRPTDRPIDLAVAGQTRVDADIGREGHRELKYVYKLKSAVNDLMWDF